MRETIPSNPGLFTITQIARALGCTRQNVHQRLGSIPADGTQVVAGQVVKAWQIDSLPAGMLRELAAKAELKRYPSVAALLNDPFARFEPPVPFAWLSPSSRDRALNLQRALKPFLALRNNSDAKTADFSARGAREFQRLFGYAITPRHWRTLFDRTVDRDNGNEEWDRAEIYVDEKPAVLPTARTISTARERGLTILEDALREVIPHGELNVERKDYVWTKSCDELQLVTDSTDEEKKRKRAILKTKNAIVKTLIQSGLFGANKETLWRNLNRHWKSYCTNGCKLRDRRRDRPKERTPDRDAHVIVGYTHAHGGDLQAGWLDARTSGNLSPGTENRYATNSTRVPSRIRRDVTHVIRSTAALVKGERAFRQDGPSVIGDYSRLFSGEVFEMDDWTPEHVCYDAHDDGRPGFKFLQGQLIVVLDVASRRVLEASFIEGSYSAGMIRVTLNRACQNYCLCDRLNIESGLWKRARLIVGRNTIGAGDWELGLREFMHVTNNRHPQGKANIENFFHALGKQMRTVPGWCGKDMRHTMPQELKSRIASAARGELHPSEFCLSKAQMFEALLDALARYNATPQHRGRLGGLSPNEAWNAFTSPNGRPSLGAKAAYLLAFHRERFAVRKAQIVKVVRGVRYVYHSPDVARFDRRDVLLWWNPLDLSQIAFSDLDRKEGPFVVPAQETTPVLAQPHYDAVRSSMDHIKNTMATRRALFKSVQPWLARAKLRPTLVDAATAEFGEALNCGVAEEKKQQQQRSSFVTKAQRRVRKSRINVLVDSRNAESKAAAAELMDEALENE